MKRRRGVVGPAREPRKRLRRCARTHKISYDNENSARFALVDRKLDAAHNDERLEARIYQCEFCGSWHLTSQEKRS